MRATSLYTLAALSIGLASFTIAEAKSPSAVCPEPATNATPAKAPDKLPTPYRAEATGEANQRLADDVKARLIGSGVARGAKFSVTTTSGVVELVGRVDSQEQGDDIVRQVKAVTGVIKVNAMLSVVPCKEIRPVATNDEPPHQVNSAPPMAGPPMMMGNNEPMPLAAPPQPSYDTTGPHLPPYAWPTYAPYPNYSRVGYPEAYPYNAFPFIGPFYPFPKVPLGWRSVKLEWDDGHWYLGRLSTPHDYWRVKFW